MSRGISKIGHPKGNAPIFASSLVLMMALSLPPQIASAESPSHAAKAQELRLDRNPAAEVGAFLRNATAEERHAFALHQAALAAEATDKAQMLQWHTRLSHVALYLVELKANPATVGALLDADQGVVSALLGRFLTTGALSRKELSSLAAELRFSVSLERTLSWLLLSLSQETPENVSGHVVLVLELRDMLQKLAPEYRAPLEASITECLTKAVSSALQQEKWAALRESHRIATAIRPNERQALLAVIAEALDGADIPEDGSDVLFALMRELQRTKASSRRRATKSYLGETLTRLAVLASKHQGNLEGTFRVRIGNTVGSLTLVDSGNGEMVAGLRYTSRATPIPYNFFHCSFAADEELFHCSRFAQGAGEYHFPDDANWSLSVKLEPSVDGKSLSVSGIFDSGEHVFPFSGARVETFDFSPTDPGPAAPERIAGEFVGAHTLKISQSGSHLWATLRYLPRGIRINFPIGHFNPLNREITFTSGVTESQQFSVLRLRVSPDGNRLEGKYIVGGRGVLFDINLHKVTR